MTHIVAALPPSERLEEQIAALGAVLGDNQLTVVTSPDMLTDSLPDAEVLVVTAFFPLTREAIGAAPKLRFIQVAGVGADHVDLEAARERNIPVAVVTGDNTSSVAEHVVMSILALLRPVTAAHNALAAGQWSLPAWMARAEDLAGKTVGILGMGRIGQEVAARLLPFGVTLMYADEKPLPEEEEELLGVTRASLDDLFASSDILTIHVPLNAATRGLVDANRLALMPPGARLVNTSRAEVIDRDALVAALKGRLAGAAIDVFHPEPPTADDPLLSLPNVLLTPHGAGVTQQAQERIAQGVVANLLRWLDGHPVADLIVEPLLEATP